jgi:hypothetical protein
MKRRQIQGKEKTINIHEGGGDFKGEGGEAK